ncbi:MAG: polysaccharide biosynthesis tyrosine autokinase [Phormidesmis sp.]
MKTDEILYLPKMEQPIGTSKEAEGTLDLGRLGRSLVRKWWLIVGLTVAGATAAGLKVLSDPPQYSALFEVLARTGSAETDVISNIPETFSGDTQDDKPVNKRATVDNDLLKILKSPTVLAPVAEQVRTAYPDFCQDPAAFEGDSVSATTLCYDSLAAGISIEALDDFLDDDPSIVEVTFQNEDPELVEFVLNGLSKSYLDYSLEIKQADIRRGIGFVEKKLPDLRRKVDTLQDDLQTLRLENNLIDPAARASQLSAQIGDFSQEQLEVAAQLRETRSIAENLNQQLAQSQDQAASSALVQSPRYQELLNALLELDAQIAEASTLYLDTSPDMQVLIEQRQNLLALLDGEGEQSQREIVSQIQELKIRDGSLEEALRQLRGDVDQLALVSRRYDDIQRELEIASENLNQFIAKREALEIDAAQRENPWEIVTPTTQPRQIETDLPKYALLGGVMGFLLGTGLALLVDESSGVIHSEEDLKRSTRLPVLGSIPNYVAASGLVSERTTIETPQYAGVQVGGERNGSTNGAGNGAGNGSVSHNGNGNGNGNGVVVSSYARDPFSESFRSLYTNIRLLSSDRPIRAIAISSVMPSEGKSTVALHLAEAAAAMGQRVLLVDADLRNPQVHKYLELSNEKGLTNLFSGESNPALIQQFSPEPNLYVIAAGSAPFDPARLFSSRSMKRFADKVKAKFDLVIYDTPPLLGQSDAYLVANNTDGLLLVTLPGKLKQPLLDRAMEQLRIADINVLGIVNRES